MNESDASKILIYYNSKNLDTKITIKDFVNFMLNDVANDKEYSSNLDSNTIYAESSPYFDESKGQ